MKRTVVGNKTFEIDAIELQEYFLEKIGEVYKDTQKKLRDTERELRAASKQRAKLNLFLVYGDLLARMGDLFSNLRGHLSHELQWDSYDAEQGLDLLLQLQYVEGFMSALASIRWMPENNPATTWFTTDVIDKNEVCVKRSIPA